MHLQFRLFKFNMLLFPVTMKPVLNNSSHTPDSIMFQGFLVLALTLVELRSFSLVILLQHGVQNCVTCCVSSSLFGSIYDCSLQCIADNYRCCFSYIQTKARFERHIYFKMNRKDSSCVLFNDVLLETKHLHIIKDKKVSKSKKN